jgi:general secretion pathway protein H
MRREHGFTLLELLMVLVIAGMTLGLVTLNAMPGQTKALQSEAQRIALLMQLARDEAILRNRPVAFEAESSGYRFLMRDGTQWAKMVKDDMLRERTFSHPPVSMSISPEVAAQTNPLRIVFGREPVDKPFVLTFVSGDAHASIRADGIGNFTVE